MSEIKELPHVPDAAGIFQFDANKKTLLVPISALEGLTGTWAAFASTNDVQILPYHNPVIKCSGEEGWKELCKAVHYSIEYGVNCNDLSSHELAENITFALDKFAKDNHLPVHDWDTDYETLYEKETDACQD